MSETATLERSVAETTLAGEHTDYLLAGSEQRAPQWRFGQLAHAVIARLEDLLNVEVMVVDEHGMVVAANLPKAREQPCTIRNPLLYVELRIDGVAGEVIIGSPVGGLPMPPRLMHTLVELVVEQLVNGERPPPRHVLKNHFIYDLLHNLFSDETTMLAESRLLGMDLAQPRAVILIDAAAYILQSSSGAPVAADEQVLQRSQAIIRSVVSFFHLPNDTICASLGSGEVAILKACNTRNLTLWADRTDPPHAPGDSWANLAALRRAGEALWQRLRADTGTTVNIGIGRHHPGIAGLPRSYQDARAALLLGRRFQTENHVHCLDRLGIAAFVGMSDEQTKIDLATFLLSPLDHEPDLIQTLVTFFANNCAASLAADRLSIHRNTLSYRLDKIAALLGLDPRRFDDAVQIRLALLMRSLCDK